MLEETPRLPIIGSCLLLPAHYQRLRQRLPPHLRSAVDREGNLCFHRLRAKYPAELYRPSPRPYRGLGELEHPFRDCTVTITHCGRICLTKRQINFSQVFAGQNVGIKEVADKIWLVSFMHYDLGFFDHETCRLEPVNKPFEPKVSTMSPI
jgi:hypothetical protein